ncbi:MAG: Ig-like domain-containing protein, partial [Moorellaceae bacterium]
MFHRHNLKTFVYLALLFLLLASIPGGSAKASGTQTGGFILLSAGKDRVIGTDDDLYVTEKGEVVKGKVDLAALGLTLADLIPSNVRIGEVLITANPQSAPADGKAAITVVAAVFDSYGNPVPDSIPVGFTASGGSLSATDVLTSKGEATTTITSTQAGAITVTAKSGDKTASVTVQFTPVVSSITLSANPQSAPADGKTAITITATLLDASGRPVPDGMAITFSTTLGTLGAITVQTANGQASTTLTSTQPGQAVVTAACATAMANTTVEFSQPFVGAKIAGGDNHSLAVKSDGTVWAWGWNYYGQLGDGTTINHTTPMRVTNLTGVVAVAAGIYHSLALKSDGTAWAWGWNGYGHLGDGTTTNRTAPVQVQGLTGVVAVAAGGYHSLALKSDGTVWAWGRNYEGQLGDGTTTNRYTPVQVKNLTGVVAVAAGYYHSLALKSDGTVWAWGRNYEGQLG